MNWLLETQLPQKRYLITYENTIDLPFIHINLFCHLFEDDYYKFNRPISTWKPPTIQEQIRERLQDKYYENIQIIPRKNINRYRYK